MNPLLVAVLFRCAIALQAKADTYASHVLVVVRVSTITTTQWVTTCRSKEVNWFINILAEESISPSRAIHKCCTSSLYLAKWIFAACYRADRVGWVFFVVFAALFVAAASSWRGNRSAFHSCGVGVQTWHALEKSQDHTGVTDAVAGLFLVPFGDGL